MPGQERKGMVILADTNIIIDIFLEREPYKTNSEIILSKCADRQIVGYLAAHSIPDIFYILRKNYTHQERRKLIKNLCSIFCIADLNLERIISAVDNEDFTDFEDCLQEECAANVMADYIVTRNPRDFEKSRVKVIEPTAFIALLQRS